MKGLARSRLLIALACSLATARLDADDGLPFPFVPHELPGKTIRLVLNDEDDQFNSELVVDLKSGVATLDEGDYRHPTRKREIHLPPALVDDLASSVARTDVRGLCDEGPPTWFRGVHTTGVLVVEQHGKKIARVTDLDRERAKLAPVLAQLADAHAIVTGLGDEPAYRRRVAGGGAERAPQIAGDPGDVIRIARATTRGAESLAFRSDRSIALGARGSARFMDGEFTRTADDAQVRALLESYEKIQKLPEPSPRQVPAPLEEAYTIEWKDPHTGRTQSRVVNKSYFDAHGLQDAVNVMAKDTLDLAPPPRSVRLKAESARGSEMIVVDRSGTKYVYQNAKTQKRGKGGRLSYTPDQSASPHDLAPGLAKLDGLPAPRPSDLVRDRSSARTMPVTIDYEDPHGDAHHLVVNAGYVLDNRDGFGDLFRAMTNAQRFALDVSPRVVWDLNNALLAPAANTAGLVQGFGAIR